MKAHTITVYTTVAAVLDEATSLVELRVEYRWRRRAGNGKIVGASTEGYGSLQRCLDNLLLVAGGKLVWTMQTTTPAGGRLWQGTWQRWGEAPLFIEAVL